MYVVVFLLSLLGDKFDSVRDFAPPQSQIIFDDYVRSFKTIQTMREQNRQLEKMYHKNLTRVIK